MIPREKTPKPLVPFRVHFADGVHVDATAESPEAARLTAMDKHPGGIVTKIKVVKGE